MTSEAPRKGSFIVQPQEKCTACQKTVYATEKIIVEEKDSKLPYHKTCLRCKTCNKVLALGTYSSMNGDFWCKPHFKQTFATKGNYDEAFGKESIKGKWAAAAVSTDAPKSFVPATEGSSEKPSSEKKETSAETAAKFQKWREEGESNKCAVCEKSVYQAEKLVVAEKNISKIYHKTCFKCTSCNINLDVRNYGSSQGKIYCMTHLKDVNKEAQNQAAAAYVPTPASFVPSSGEGEGEKKTEAKNETSEKTAAIINKFRTEGDGNLCTQCNKTVYATERLILEEKDNKKLMHKTCLKCSHCQKQLELGNYSSNEGVYYCKPHFKQLFAAKGNYDEGFGRERKGTSNVVLPGQSFVPKVEDEKITPNKQSNPETAEKFKSLGSSGVSEKCKACGKTVYATEKVAVEELKNQTIYHKNCFRCSACNVKLDLSSYGSSAGTIYCKTHLKQLGKPEASKDVGFISPLHKATEGESQERDQVQSERVGEEREEESENNRNEDRNENRDENREENNNERESNNDDSNNNRQEEEERENRERENRDRENREREEQERKERESREESSRPSESDSSRDRERQEDDDKEKEREERRKERERRKKEREEEEERAEEERKKRQEERKKRLQAMDS